MFHYLTFYILSNTVAEAAKLVCERMHEREQAANSAILPEEHQHEALGS